MNHAVTRRILTAAITLGSLCTGAAALAQTQKITRPVKLVVGYSPGGTTDILARLLADNLRTAIDQTVIVDNKPGASGTLASQSVKTAAPDGTTLLLQPMAPMVLVPQIYKGYKIDPRHDFVPIAEVASIPIAVAVGPKSTSTTLAALGAASQGSAAGAQYAIPGVGGLAHLVGAQLSATGRFKWSPVAYKASMGYLPELSNGEIAAAIDTMPEMVPMHQTGKIKIIAVSSAARSPLLPEVPTFQEMGFKEAESLNWFGLFAPAGTDPKLIAYLNQKLNAVLQNPETAKRMRAQGFEPIVSTPEGLAKVLDEDYKRWGTTIRALKLDEEVGK
jgi:tripartite-type tricarboxylate transporter receptor subunit TctC